MSVSHDSESSVSVLKCGGSKTGNYSSWCLTLLRHVVRVAVSIGEGTSVMERRDQAARAAHAWPHGYENPCLEEMTKMPPEPNWTPDQAPARAEAAVLVPNDRASLAGSWVSGQSLASSKAQAGAAYLTDLPGRRRGGREPLHFRTVASRWAPW